MSYLWYSFFGAVVTLVSGMVTSYFTGLRDISKVNPSYVSPVIRKYLPKRRVVEHDELLKPI